MSITNVPNYISGRIVNKIIFKHKMPTDYIKKCNFEIKLIHLLKKFVQNGFETFQSLSPSSIIYIKVSLSLHKNGVNYSLKFYAEIILLPPKMVNTKHTVSPKF